MVVPWVLMAVLLNLVFLHLKHPVFSAPPEEGPFGVNAGRGASCPETLGDGGAVARKPAIGQG